METKKEFSDKEAKTWFWNADSPAERGPKLRISDPMLPAFSACVIMLGDQMHFSNTGSGGEGLCDPSVLELATLAQEQRQDSPRVEEGSLTPAVVILEPKWPGPTHLSPATGSGSELVGPATSTGAYRRPLIF